MKTQWYLRERDRPTLVLDPCILLLCIGDCKRVTGQYLLSNNLPVVFLGSVGFAVAAVMAVSQTLAFDVVFVAVSLAVQS